jgi:hypothetical protein
LYEDGKRKSAAAQAHQKEKTDQIVVADEKRHCGYQLGVTAAEKATPEEEKCGYEYDSGRLKRVSGRQRISSRDHPNQAGYGDNGSERIGNASRLYVAIGDDREDADRGNNDYRLHRSALETRDVPSWRAG